MDVITAMKGQLLLALIRGKASNIEHVCLWSKCYGVPNIYAEKFIRVCGCV